MKRLTVGLMAVLLAVGLGWAKSESPAHDGKGNKGVLINYDGGAFGPETRRQDGDGDGNTYVIMMGPVTIGGQPVTIWITQPVTVIQGEQPVTTWSTQDPATESTLATMAAAVATSALQTAANALLTTIDASLTAANVLLTSIDATLTTISSAVSTAANQLIANASLASMDTKMDEYELESKKSIVGTFTNADTGNEVQLLAGQALIQYQITSITVVCRGGLAYGSVHEGAVESATNQFAVFDTADKGGMGKDDGKMGRKLAVNTDIYVNCASIAAGTTVRVLVEYMER